MCFCSFIEYFVEKSYRWIGTGIGIGPKERITRQTDHYETAEIFK